MRNNVPARRLSKSCPVNPLVEARRTCKLEEAAVRRRARDREAAAATFRQHHVEILPRPEMQFLDRRQAQEHRHDVVGDAVHPLDAARQALHLDVGRRPDLARLDPQVRQRSRLAQQRVALARLALGQAGRHFARVLERALENARAARRAVAALATVRQVQPGAQRGCEHGLVTLRNEALAGRDQRDLGHGGRMPRRRGRAGHRVDSRILGAWIKPA